MYFMDRSALFAYSTSMTEEGIGEKRALDRATDGCEPLCNSWELN